MARTAKVPPISLAILPCLHTKCQGTVIALKATWIKKQRLSYWILWNWWIKKCKRVKNRWGKLQKMVAWRWTKSKWEQVFIGPIHREESVTEFGDSRNTGVFKGNLKAGGKWTNLWKIAKLSAEWPSSTRAAVAGRLSPGLGTWGKKWRQAGREGQGSKSKGRAGGLNLQTADKAQGKHAESPGTRSVQGVLVPSLTLLHSVP